jgi:hypothetical protein
MDMCNALVDQKIRDSRSLKPERNCIKLGWNCKRFSRATYSCVIESKSEEWQLEVEIFVNLLIWSVDVSLKITRILRTTFVKEPVHEITSDLSKTFVCDCVAATVISVCWRLIWCYAIVWIWKSKRMWLSLDDFKDLKLGIRNLQALEAYMP